jgi:hypothetical protein
MGMRTIHLVGGTKKHNGSKPFGQKVCCYVAVEFLPSLFLKVNDSLEMKKPRWEGAPRQN